MYMYFPFLFIKEVSAAASSSGTSSAPLAPVTSPSATATSFFVTSASPSVVGRPAHPTRACERSGAVSERGAERAKYSRFLSKGWSDRSVSLLFRSDTAHTTSLGHAQIHPEFTCAFSN